MCGIAHFERMADAFAHGAEFLPFLGFEAEHDEQTLGGLERRPSMREMQSEMAAFVYYCSNTRGRRLEQGWSAGLYCHRSQYRCDYCCNEFKVFVRQIVTKLHHFSPKCLLDSKKVCIFAASKRIKENKEE